MSLSGRLDDVPLQDIVQFLHVNGRSGTLLLRRPGESASILFEQGNIVSAFGPGKRQLGEILIGVGVISEADLTAMIQRQRDEASTLKAWNMKSDRRPLGTILLEEGLVTEDQLRAAIKRQVEETIYTLVTWRSGEFEFVAGGVTKADDFVITPLEVLPPGAINTQFVLFEALRLLDEKVHAERSEPDPLLPGPAPEAAEVPRAKQPFTVLVTAEAVVRSTLRRAFEDMGYLVAETTDPVTAKLWLAEGVARGQALVAVVDLELPPEGDEAQPGRALALSLAWTYPEALLLCFSEQAPAEQLHELYRAGVRAVLPGPSAWGADREADAQELAMSALCVASLAQPQGADATGALRRWLEQLRDALGQVRDNPQVSTVALGLLQLVGEHAERAVLMQLRGGELVGLGAFGSSTATGEELADVTRSMRLPVDRSAALQSCIEERRPVRGRCDTPEWPALLLELIGQPRSRDAVLIPVVASGETVCVLFADNGGRQAPVREIDLLDFAAAQMGLALECGRARRPPLPPAVPALIPT